MRPMSHILRHLLVPDDSAKTARGNAHQAPKLGLGGVIGAFFRKTGRLIGFLALHKRLQQRIPIPAAAPARSLAA